MRFKRFELTPEQLERRELPYSRWLPIIVGAVVGLLLRLLFSGHPGKPFAPMLSAFIVLAPLLVGAVTVYFAERRQHCGWMYYVTASALATLLFVLGSLVMMIEGIICAVVIVPLFVALGILGGLIMGAICRYTKWPKKALYSFSVLPLLLGVVEPYFALPQHAQMVERRIMIAAPGDIVWQQLMNTPAIQPEEVQEGWMYRIGVPLPESGLTKMQSQQLVRQIKMGKNIHFEQRASEWKEQEFVRWQYHFDEDSIPPAALDDHVKIGGHYFDLQSTTYRLHTVGEQTELHIQMQYRVSTSFNWYAEPLAALLIGNFSETILDFYRQRSERAMTR